MNKKIITIAEIVFALVFVVLLSVFMATINSKGNTSNNQLVDTLEMTSGTSIDKYLNLTSTTIKGSEVISAATNYKTMGGNTKLQVIVHTGAGDISSYGYATKGVYQKGSKSAVPVGEEIGTYSAPVTTADDYINPSADFWVYADENTNGVHDYLRFVQKQTTDETVRPAEPTEYVSNK